VYGWLWRHVPGPVAVRALVALLVLAGIVLLLFMVVFPAAEPYLPFNHVTVDTTTGTPAPAGG